MNEISERNIISLPESELLNMPHTKEYVKNYIQLRNLENQISVLFIPAWNELASTLNDKSTAFVDNFIFKLGFSIYEKPHDSVQPNIDHLYAKRQAVLEDAVKNNQATSSTKSNFTVKLPGYHQEPKLDTKQAKELIAALPTNKSKLKTTLKDFSDQFPVATQALLLKNQYRLLEKRQKSIWSAACTELSSKFSSEDTVHTTVDNVKVTIAVFDTPHITFQNHLSASPYKDRFNQLSEDIKNLHQQYIKNNKTSKSYTLFFTAYTV